MKAVLYQSRVNPLQPATVTVDSWYMQHPGPPKAKPAPGIACLTAGMVLALQPIGVPADGWSRATNPNPDAKAAPGIACLTAGAVLPLQPVSVPFDGLQPHHPQQPPRRAFLHPTYLPGFYFIGDAPPVTVPDLTIGLRANLATTFVTTEGDLSAWTTSYIVHEYTKD